MISYLALIRAIKQVPDGFTFKSDVPNDVFKKVIHLAATDCIELAFPKKGVIVATVRTQSTETTPTPVIERVQVSFWRDGARKGMYSQQAYKVTGTPREGFITVELMNGKPYTVAVKHTKVVA